MHLNYDRRLTLRQNQDETPQLLNGLTDGLNHEFEPRRKLLPLDELTDPLTSEVELA